MKLLQKISSKSNNKVSDMSALINDKKYRKASSKIVCEGSKMLEEALEYAIIDTVFIDEDKEQTYTQLVEKCLMQDINVYSMPSYILEKLSETQTPQGIIFSCSRKIICKEYADCNNILILDTVQDPGNIGTILRTAEAFGIDKVILGTGCADISSGKVIRSTMGAIFRQDTESGDLSDIITELKKQKFEIIGTALEADSTEFCNNDVLGKKAFIIGNEGKGICQNILALCDRKIILPMSGKAESLNASVAATIIMWEINKKGRDKNGNL